MLAGLKSDIESMFPALTGIGPSEEELEEGAKKLKFGRTVKLSGYKTELFDMHDAKDRAAYAKRMMDLSQRIQVGKVNILQNDRQVLSRKDGSTGWFVYLEWMEFALSSDERKAK